MVHTEIGDSVSDTISESDGSVSDSGSVICDSTNPEFESFERIGLIRLEGNQEHDIIKNRFILGLGPLGRHTAVVAIHKNSFSSFHRKARLQSFSIFSEAILRKCHGNANIKYAWYGTSRDGVHRIITHGFGEFGNPENDRLYGCGLYLSPENSSIESAMASDLDESGLRHLLLCRVILGNMEEILPGSEQFHPSSEDFDSGVDNLSTPRKYIIWNTHMNSHILPEYVISFRAPPCLKEFQRIQEHVVKKPTSAWMPFPTLISVLSRFLKPTSIACIEKYHNDYRAKKISRQYLIQRVRQIAGDKLLVAVIKSCRNRNFRTTMGTSPSSSSSAEETQSTHGTRGLNDAVLTKCVPEERFCSSKSLNFVARKQMKISLFSYCSSPPKSSAASLKSLDARPKSRLKAMQIPIIQELQNQLEEGDERQFLQPATPAE
ncbi:hypothetical protein NE237_006475 [Protea cynaroides]|uniref:Poly [ADP-ribose] polymerase n=1 Tax=Protea cynaroides TaxID=273540 RepID=A0A9Q0KMK1_9MAGN|nr:hypothetical protein NE237_006475 [Protea cynaroides]